ncbi:MAG: hypothetical protein ACRERC_13625 [Candidatus Binatia bacterium]
MQTWNRIIVGTACALTLGACSMFGDKTTETAAAPAAAATPIVSGTLVENAATVTATVVSIDQKTRKVSLKGPDGKIIKVKVDEAVQNLPQVKVGDEVVASFYESVVYDVVAPGSAQPGVAVAAEAGRAQPGARPGAVGARAITVTATIDSIDKANMTVTLKGPDGELDTVKVRDAAKLAKVSPGDLVQITYTEALAIAVTAAPKK